MRHGLSPIFAAPVFFLLAACATTGPTAEARLERVAIAPTATNDIWEGTNRKIYRFNKTMDDNLVAPVTRGYRFVVPVAPRRGISNVYRLAREPGHALNAGLQGKPKGVLRAFARIAVNTVLGLGLADHATGMGLDAEPHDFGQTMAVWGVSSGPYLYTPFFGPSTVRDTAGFVIDFIFDPFDFAKNKVLNTEQRFLYLGGRGLDIRSRLMDQGEQLLTGAADPYATTRAAWLQLRRYELFDGMPPIEDDGLDDSDFLDDDSPAPTPATPPEDAPPAAEGQQ